MVGLVIKASVTVPLVALLTTYVVGTNETRSKNFVFVGEILENDCMAVVAICRRIRVARFYSRLPL
jgi:hypothetical protein